MQQPLPVVRSSTCQGDKTKYVSDFESFVIHKRTWNALSDKACSFATKAKLPGLGPHKVLPAQLRSLAYSLKARLAGNISVAAMADDSVLDDALDDFRSTAPASPKPADVKSSHDSARAANAPTASHSAADAAASKSAPSRPVAFDPLGSKAGPASKTAAFDPLKKRSKQSAGPKAARSKAPPRARARPLHLGRRRDHQQLQHHSRQQPQEQQLPVQTGPSKRTWRGAWRS